MRRTSVGALDAHDRTLGDDLPSVTRTGAAALCETVTIDLDPTDVEVYGRQKQGVAFDHQGQRVGRPLVAAWPGFRSCGTRAWADTATVLGADPGCLPDRERSREQPR